MLAPGFLQSRHLRLRLQAALLPRARPLGRRHGHAVPHHQRRPRSSKASTAAASPTAASTSGGVLALDDGLDGDGGHGRGALAAIGAFALGDGFVADFDLNVASDDSFLAAVRLFRRRPADQRRHACSAPATSDYFEIGTVAFQSLPEDEDDRRRPLRPPRVHLPPADRRRPGSAAGSGSSANSLGILRDDRQQHDARRRRASTGGSDWIAAARRPGLGAPPRRCVDVYQVWDNPDMPDGIEAQAAADRRRRAALAAGPHHAGGRATSSSRSPRSSTPTSSDQKDVPNEDSQLPEFDETNLFSLNRFPGIDRLETGLRANLGVSYTRHDPAGWSIGAHARPGAPRRAGRRLRRGHRASAAASRTTSPRSRSTSPGACSLVNRALFDTELRLPPQRVRARLRRRARRRCRPPTSTSPRTTSNPILGPQPETNEFALDARYRVRRTGSCAASGATTSPPTATCAPAPASPTATSAPSSTFRSRVAIPHRIISRPRPRSGSACAWRASARRASDDWPAQGLHGARDLTGARRSDDADDVLRAAGGLPRVARRPGAAPRTPSRRRSPSTTA